MPPKSSDPQAKATAAGAQLQQALVSASEALKIIAEAIPALFPQARDSFTTRPTGSVSPDGNQPESSVAPPTSNKRKRKEKDPDAPEKPLSAYHLYAKEKRDQIKATMAGTPSPNDVILELNRQWKGLTDELKKVCSSSCRCD